MNILFPNVGRRVELVQRFIAAGAKVFGTDIDMSAPALAFVQCPEKLDITDDDALKAYIHEHDIELIIPTIDPDLLRLVDRDLGCTVLVSSKEAVKTCDDKRAAREIVRRKGIAVTQLVDSETCDLPYHRKPRFGSGSAGAGLQYNNEKSDDSIFIDEQVLIGTEVTVDVLLDLKGHTLMAVCRERIRVRGGEVTKAVIIENEMLESRSIIIAQSMGCTGPVTVQFKNNVFIEINARMGGGLPLTIAAGGDWPGMIIDMVVGRETEVCTILEGMSMARYDQSVFTKPMTAYTFDLDDTLYLEQDYAYAGIRAVAAQIYSGDGLDVEWQLRAIYDSGNRENMFGQVLPCSSEECIQDIVNTYRFNTSKLYPRSGIQKLINLKVQGHKIGLVTHGLPNVQNNKIDRLGIRGLFDVIVIGDKQTPEPYERALQDLGVASRDMTHVGNDDITDGEIPRSLGIRTMKFEELP